MSSSNLQHVPPVLLPVKSPARYSCSHCASKLSRNQAKTSNGFCTHCGYPLKAFSMFYNPLYGISAKIMAKQNSMGYDRTECPAQHIDRMLMDAFKKRYEESE